MYRAAILMSTYNGEKYLREQIDSILAQENVEIMLYIRDDGSRDRTIEILEDYKKNNTNIKLVKGENIGVGNSFMQLVYEVEQFYDYYAFADQDDIWLPEKIERAIEQIEENQNPVLYCSNQTLVDRDGKIIRERHAGVINTSFMQILCDNNISGCTMVWNKALQKMLADEKKHPTRELLRKRIHDVWVAMVASVSGTIYYDPNSYIYYRQHENNVVGVKESSVLKEWRKKITEPELRNGRSDLAAEITDRFKDNITDQRTVNTLWNYGNYKKRLFNRAKLLHECNNLCYYSGESALGLAVKILMGLF